MSAVRAAPASRARSSVTPPRPAAGAPRRRRRSTRSARRRGRHGAWRSAAWRSYSATLVRALSPAARAARRWARRARRGARSGGACNCQCCSSTPQPRASSHSTCCSRATAPPHIIYRSSCASGTRGATAASAAGPRGWRGSTCTASPTLRSCSPQVSTAAADCCRPPSPRWHTRRGLLARSRWPSVTLRSSCTSRGRRPRAILSRPS